MRTKMSEMASACDADALLAKLQETHQVRSQTTRRIVHLPATRLLARKLRCARLWKAASNTSDAELHCLLRKLSEEWQVMQVPIIPILQVALFPRRQLPFRILRLYPLI